MAAGAGAGGVAGDGAAMGALSVGAAGRGVVSSGHSQQRWK